MKNVRVKVVKDSCFGSYEFGICQHKKLLLVNPKMCWQTEAAAIRNAKAMAKRIGIKYDPEIVKLHGC